MGRQEKKKVGDERGREQRGKGKEIERRKR